MNFSKWESGILLLTAVFLSFSAGWVLRGEGTEPLRVESQRRLEVTVTALPAPEAEEEREPVNLNTAGVEELMTLPGIGEKRAADIIADREENGPFRFVEEITWVKGIGEETLAELIDYVTVEEEP